MKLMNLLGALAIALSTTQMTAVSAEELSIANFVPPQPHTNSYLFRRFAEGLDKRSGGSLATKLYPAGQLGAGPVQFAVFFVVMNKGVSVLIKPPF